jgi:hypothetical protein
MTTPNDPDSGQWGTPPGDQPAQYGTPGGYPPPYPPTTGYAGADVIPASVKTVSVLLFIGGGFGALAGLLLLLASAVAAIFAVVAVVFLAIGALEIVLGLKIRTGVAWARTTATVLAGLSVVLGLGSIGKNGSSVISILLNGVILYLLWFEPKAKAFFDSRR